MNDISKLGRIVRIYGGDGGLFYILKCLTDKKKVFLYRVFLCTNPLRDSGEEYTVFSSNDLKISENWLLSSLQTGTTLINSLKDYPLFVEDTNGCLYVKPRQTPLTCVPITVKDCCIGTITTYFFVVWLWRKVYGVDSVVCNGQHYILISNGDANGCE